MAKPVKGSRNKRPASDVARLASAHLLMLKGDKAIVSKSFEVPDGFKSTSINDKQVRVKGLGIQAIKQASNKDRDEVIRAVADRNWKRVVTLIPREDAAPIDYKVVVVTAARVEQSRDRK